MIGDEVMHYDGVVQSYMIDMPNYHNISDLPNFNKQTAMTMKVLLERAQFEQNMMDVMTAHIRFLDKDTYIWTFDGIDEGFPYRY